MKTLITILFAWLVKKRNIKWINNPIETQTKTLNRLLQKAVNTEFGKDHKFPEYSHIMTLKLMCQSEIMRVYAPMLIRLLLVIQMSCGQANRGISPKHRGQHLG